MEWTKADAAHAAKEGWKFRNGYVAPVHSHHFNFMSTYDVIKHLIQQARISKWHRDLYMELPWTEADNLVAQSEGWKLYSSNNGTFIWACNRVKFPTSEDAEAFVHAQATKEDPDPLCIKAITKLTKVRLLQGT